MNYIHLTIYRGESLSRLAENHVEKKDAREIARRRQQAVRKYEPKEKAVRRLFGEKISPFSFASLEY